MFLLSHLEEFFFLIFFFLNVQSSPCLLPSRSNHRVHRGRGRAEPHSWCHPSTHADRRTSATMLLLQREKVSSQLRHHHAPPPQPRTDLSINLALASLLDLDIASETFSMLYPRKSLPIKINYNLFCTENWNSFFIPI